METVEMDLMQAQIGSLATDVSRLEAKVATGGGGIEVIHVYDITPLSPTVFVGKIDKSFDEIVSLFKAGKCVYSIVSIPQFGTFSDFIYYLNVGENILGLVHISFMSNQPILIEGKIAANGSSSVIEYDITSIT